LLDTVSFISNLLTASDFGIDASSFEDGKVKVGALNCVNVEAVVYRGDYNQS